MLLAQKNMDNESRCFEMMNWYHLALTRNENTVIIKSEKVNIID